MFRVPEVVFQPETAKLEPRGYQDIIKDAILSVDQDLQEVMASNIVLTGGNTMFEGFGIRLWNELHQLNFAKSKIKILATPDRTHMVWKGGSILAALSTFQTMWITKAEYEEYGPSIIHSKCI